MATVQWLGNAVAIKDKWTLTIANTWAAGDTATLTINGKDLVVTIGTLVTTAQVATTIKEAWESGSFTDTTASVSPSGGGTSIPEMSELTATVSGSTVIFTADTAGVPHTISATESTAGTGTASIAHTTTATGPNYWDNSDNWDGGSVPVSTDTVYIDRPVSILYGLDQNAVTLAALEISPRFTASAYIGLPSRNANGYDEYREEYLKISVTAFTTFSNSGRIKLNFGTAQNTSHVYSTGSTAETDRSALQILGTHASNAINVYGGDVGIARNTGDVSTYATVKQTGGTLEFGSGVTLTNVTNTGGTLVVASSTTTLLHEAGTLVVRGGTQTALTALTGTVTLTGSTAVTTLRVGTATVDAGINVTFTTIDSAEGTLTIQSGLTTLTSDGGTVTVTSGSITTANINGGTFAYKGTGTIGTLNIRPAGLSGDETITIDFTGTTAACTVTTLNLTARPVEFVDPSSRVAWTNGFPVGGTITFE
jgi:hypothetical protein